MPIHGYGGSNGQGKTHAMVRDTLPSLALGRPVLSTVELLDPITRQPHPLYIPFVHWDQLLDFRDGDILFDEVTGIMDSRDSGMPKRVRRLLPQMRRRNVLIRWTGIDWDNADLRLRQVTQGFTMCRGYRPDYSAQRSSGTVDALSMWAPNRLFSMVTYDAKMMSQSKQGDQLTQEKDKKRKAKVLAREWYRASQSIAFDCYNTLADVLAISNDCPFVDPDTGEVCGGKIPEKSCKGHNGAPPWALHVHGSNL